jgi:hypothetical protein
MMMIVRAGTTRHFGGRRRNTMAAIARDQRQKAARDGEDIKPNEPLAKPAVHGDAADHHGFHDRRSGVLPQPR